MKPPVTLGALVTANVDPVLRQRAGLKGDLVAQWSQIAGAELAPHCTPIKLRWPKPVASLDDDEGQLPATLVVSATGIWALRVQHTTGELLDRINRYFGYQAVSRIAIEQRSAFSQPAKRVLPNPDSVVATEAKKIDGLVEKIDDPALKETMRKLGRYISADAKLKK